MALQHTTAICPWTLTAEKENSLKTLSQGAKSGGNLSESK